MITLVNTVAKFTFICIFKSIPSMDDNFLAAYAVISINMISALSATVRIYLPGRPTPSHVLELIILSYIFLIITLVAVYRDLLS